MNTDAFEGTELMGGPIVEPRVLRDTSLLDREAKRLETMRRYSASLQARDYEFQQSAQKEFNLGAWLFATTLVIVILCSVLLYFMP